MTQDSPVTAASRELGRLRDKAREGGTNPAAMQDVHTITFAEHVLGLVRPVEINTFMGRTKKALYYVRENKDV